MGRTSLAIILTAAAALPFAAAAAMAGDEPVTGLPEDSIAKGWNDPVRASFAQRGVTYGLNYTGEFYDVTSGGVSRGSTYNGLIETYVDVDLQKALGWRGATFHANAYYVHGIGPTNNTGSIFAVSNLEGFETVRLDELWLEQALLDDKLKIKVGAIAADTEFFISDTAGAFLNGTFGWAGIVASDMIQGGPAYPLTSMGARVAFTPNDNLTLMAGLFNGSPANPFADDPQKDNRHGTDFRFGDGELLIMEGAYKYDVGLPGTVKLGGWKQFSAPDGIYTDFTTGANLRSEHGLYAILDQQIWKDGDDKGVSVFARVSGSPTDRSPMDLYFDTGFVASGLVPGRAKDSFGAAFGMAGSRTI